MKSRYRYLVRRHDRWFVRMIVPADVQASLGKRVLIEATGEADEHRAATVAAPIIASMKEKTAAARRGELTDPKLAEMTNWFRELKRRDPEMAHAFLVAEVIPFLVNRGHSGRDFGQAMVQANFDAKAALRSLPRGDVVVDLAERISGEATPFLAHLDAWKPHAAMKPRQLDQAISTLKSFAKAVNKPIERIEGKDVQGWVDAQINAQGETGLSAKTVNRKLSELRSYWSYLQSVDAVPEDRQPFHNRRVRDPVSRRKTKEDERQRFRPAEVVTLWQKAEAIGDAVLRDMTIIAAYSGARIEGVAQLKTSDIRIDPESGVRFMQMADKTTAGDRWVPVHPEIDSLIDVLIAHADRDGYLIHSTAKNKYGERSQPLGKRFGRLKTEMGFDERYVFHSIRKTVASLFQNAGCPEGVAADIVGHMKPTMTYGLYGGETAMKLRAEWLAKAIRYPNG